MKIEAYGELRKSHLLSLKKSLRKSRQIEIGRSFCSSCALHSRCVIFFFFISLFLFSHIIIIILIVIIICLLEWFDGD